MSEQRDVSALALPFHELLDTVVLDCQGAASTTPTRRRIFSSSKEPTAKIDNDSLRSSLDKVSRAGVTILNPMAVALIQSTVPHHVVPVIVSTYVVAPLLVVTAANIRQFIPDVFQSATFAKRWNNANDDNDNGHTDDDHSDRTDDDDDTGRRAKAQHAKDHRRRSSSPQKQRPEMKIPKKKFGKRFENPDQDELRLSDSDNDESTALIGKSARDYETAASRSLSQFLNSTAQCLLLQQDSSNTNDEDGAGAGCDGGRRSGLIRGSPDGNGPCDDSDLYWSSMRTIPTEWLGFSPPSRRVRSPIDTPAVLQLHIDAGALLSEWKSNHGYLHLPFSNHHPKLARQPPPSLKDIAVASAKRASTDGHCSGDNVGRLTREVTMPPAPHLEEDQVQATVTAHQVQANDPLRVVVGEKETVQVEAGARIVQEVQPAQEVHQGHHSPRLPLKVRDVVCSNVETNEMLQLCIAVATKLEASGFSAAGSLDRCSGDWCAGFLVSGSLPTRMDLSGLTKLSTIMPPRQNRPCLRTGVAVATTPWHGVQSLKLPPLSARGLSDSALFHAADLEFISFGERRIVASEMPRVNQSVQSANEANCSDTENVRRERGGAEAVTSPVSPLSSSGLFRREVEAALAAASVAENNNQQPPAAQVAQEQETVRLAENSRQCLERALAVSSVIQGCDNPFDLVHELCANTGDSRSGKPDRGPDRSHRERVRPSANSANVERQSTRKSGERATFNIDVAVTSNTAKAEAIAPASDARASVSGRCIVTYSNLERINARCCCFAKLRQLDFRFTPLLSTIQSHAFQGCSALTRVCFRGLLHISLDSFKQTPFSQCGCLAIIDLCECPEIDKLGLEENQTHLTEPTARPPPPADVLCEPYTLGQGRRRQPGFSSHADARPVEHLRMREPRPTREEYEGIDRHTRPPDGRYIHEPSRSLGEEHDHAIHPQIRQLGGTVDPVESDRSSRSLGQEHEHAIRPHHHQQSRHHSTASAHQRAAGVNSDVVPIDDERELEDHLADMFLQDARRKRSSERSSQEPPPRASSNDRQPGFYPTVVESSRPLPEVTHGADCHGDVSPAPQSAIPVTSGLPDRTVCQMSHGPPPPRARSPQFTGGPDCHGDGSPAAQSTIPVISGLRDRTHGVAARQSSHGPPPPRARSPLGSPDSPTSHHSSPAPHTTTTRHYHHHVPNGVPQPSLDPSDPFGVARAAEERRRLRIPDSAVFGDPSRGTSSSSRMHAPSDNAPLRHIIPDSPSTTGQSFNQRRGLNDDGPDSYDRLEMAPSRSPIRARLPSGGAVSPGDGLSPGGRVSPRLSPGGRVHVSPRLAPSRSPPSRTQGSGSSLTRPGGGSVSPRLSPGDRVSPGRFSQLHHAPPSRSRDSLYRASPGDTMPAQTLLTALGVDDDPSIVSPCFAGVILCSSSAAAKELSYRLSRNAPRWTNRSVSRTFEEASPEGVFTKDQPVRSLGQERLSRASDKNRSGIPEWRERQKQLQVALSEAEYALLPRLSGHDASVIVGVSCLCHGKQID